MSYLETLTPAENLLLRDGGKTRLRDLLKATLLDLLMRKVLVFNEVLKDPDKRGRARRYKYVQPGPAFSERTALPHEDVFTGPYANNHGERYLLKNLVRIGFSRAVNVRAYHNRVLGIPRMLPLFSSGAWAKLFGIVRLSATGKVARDVLLTELARAEAELVPLLNANDERARTLLCRLNGNVLLLSGFDLALLADMDLGDFDRPMKPGGGGGCGGGGCSSFTGFDHGFDSGADSAGGDGGSGCGGGCGGSGCGGCGGCS